MPHRWDPKQRPWQNPTVLVELGSGHTRVGIQRYLNAVTWHVDPNGDLVVHFDGDGRVLVPAGTWMDVHWD